jgi:hypothetical protein
LPDKLPDVTIVIEWENAIDVEDKWTKRAMSAFEIEMLRCSPGFTSRPTVLYLYDSESVAPDEINERLRSTAPKLRDCCDVKLIAAPGLSYYKLKNRGAELANTDIVVMLDSDAAPRSGWLTALLAPFADPEVKAVGGFTVLGHEDLLSRTMALSWIFDLPSEREKTRLRKKIHANNCAFRRDFLLINPFPDLEAFKKQCGFWLRRIEARGVKWVRTPDAMTIHAPHPGGRFILWRAWTTGLDRDFQTYHTLSRSRIIRFFYSFYFFARKVSRSWWRIATRGAEAELSVWQRPLAMLLGLGFFFVALCGELYSTCFRSFTELPKDFLSEALLEAA